MRKLKLGICNFCEVKKGIVAKGLCRACYQRKQKTGSLEYKRNGRNICSVVDCDDFVVTMGLCDKHRQRVVKHGSIEQTRPVDWGKREKHPLYGTWISIRRSRNRSMCIEWRNDFWRFVKDVKEKPSKAHKIKPKDPDSVFSKDNCYWHLPIPYNKEGNEIRNALLREDRKQNPDKYRHAALMKSFGIGLIEYNKMSHGQSNVCAICKEPEKSLNPKTGKARYLAVDHCHDSGKIRGLLCSRCNTAIGMLNDDIQLLSNSVDYLKNAK